MPPIIVQAIGAEVAAQARDIARALPYRPAIGVDPQRIVWIEVAGRERIGLAYTPDDPDGPHWMIAIARLDGTRIRRSDVRRVIDQLVGPAIPYELAPPLDSAPHLTLVRVRAD